jgi:hypothetical protein
MRKPTSFSQFANSQDQAYRAGDLDALLVLMLDALYGLQTPDEQAEKRTIKRNGVGLNAVDARVLTGMAVKARFRSLSESEMDELRARLPKYRKQLQTLGLMPRTEQAA